MATVQHRARLLLISQQQEILKEFSIEEQAIIGRLSSSNVVINNDEVSRIHAQIFSTPKGFYISDLDSTNGTIVNGQHIENNRLMPLQSNDTIYIGNAKLIFQIVPASVPAPQKQKTASTVTESPFSTPVYHAPVHSLSKEVKDKHNSQVVKETLGNLEQDNLNAKKNLLTSLRERLKNSKSNIKNNKQAIPVEATVNNDDDELGGITSTITDTPAKPSKDFSSTFEEVKTHNLFEGISNYNSQELNSTVNYQPPFPSEELENSNLPEENFDFLRESTNSSPTATPTKQKVQKSQTGTNKNWFKNIAEDIKLTITGKSPNKFISYSIIGLTVGAGAFAYYKYTPIFS